MSKICAESEASNVPTPWMWSAGPPGVPAERKQLEEQQTKLKASLDQQTSTCGHSWSIVPAGQTVSDSVVWWLTEAESILKLKSVLNPRAKSGKPEVAKMEVQPPADDVEDEEEVEQEEDAKAVKMDVDKSVHRPVSKKTSRAKKRVSKLPPKKLCEFK